MDPKLVWLDRFGLFDRSKAPGPDDFATTSQIDDFDSRLAATPSFLWLTTPGNDRFAQIQAGRAFVRAQLAAAAHGVSMQPLQQALQEYAEQRPNHHAIHRLCGATQPGQTVQMWARVGHAPSVHPAPRRALNNFIHS
jgi:hypothetical protein